LASISILKRLVLRAIGRQKSAQIGELGVAVLGSLAMLQTPAIQPTTKKWDIYFWKGQNPGN
jgi:hypothetical protein